MKRLLIMLVGLVLTPMLMVACAPNRIYESFFPQHRAQADCGFVQNVYGERISWKGHVPVRLKVHESFPQKYLPALEDAIQHWESVAGEKIFEIESTSYPGPLNPRQDGENIIYWLYTWEENKPTEQARTTVFWVGDRINEADIRINAKNFNFFVEEPQNATDVHLTSLLIHELGHVLGLKHDDTGGSVMATYLASDTVRTDLVGL